jgi:hypothetical protein
MVGCLGRVSGGGGQCFVAFVTYKELGKKGLDTLEKEECRWGIILKRSSVNGYRGCGAIWSDLGCCRDFVKVFSDTYKVKGHPHFSYVLEHDFVVWGVENSYKVSLEEVYMFSEKLHIFHGGE